jgi:hypothetical protein
MLHMLVTLLVVRMRNNVLKDENHSLGKLIFIQTRSAMDASV